MDLTSLLTARHSCRAFLPDPVPEETIRAVLSLAQRTPSWRNTQAWQVHLVSGGALDRFSRHLLDHVDTGEVRADLGLPAYTPVHDQRVVEAERGLHDLLGIAPDDEPAREQQARENFRFYGAPHTAVLTTDRDLGAYGVFDCGGYATTWLLAAQEHGLGAIVQGVIAMYSDAVRSWLDLSDDRLVVAAISFGYADSDHPANHHRTTRADLDTVVHRIDS